MDQRQQIQAAIAAYFPAEKRDSLLLAVIGIAAIGASIELLLQDGIFLGMAVPLTAVALLQIAVGGRSFFKTNGRVRSLKSKLASSPSKKALRELERMKKVARTIRIFRAVEIGLLAIALVSAVLLRERPLLAYGSLGLAAQALLMLLFDLAAERRAKAYIEALVIFVRAVS